MTTAFYTPPSSIRGDRVLLPDDEARHASTVLRKQAGDSIVVVDGEGGWHRVQIDHVSRSQVVGTRMETRREVGEMNVSLTVGLGLLKSRNRFETFLEKGVELGAAHLIPLTSDRTEKETLRRERTHNLLVAALKQCGRSRLPTVPSPQPVADVAAEADADLRLICHRPADAAGTLLQALRRAAAPASITVLVGPEGGFTDGEVAAATEEGFVPVSLGPRRLRAETAGITAAATVATWAAGR